MPNKHIAGSRQATIETAWHPFTHLQHNQWDILLLIISIQCSSFAESGSWVIRMPALRMNVSQCRLLKGLSGSQEERKSQQNANTHTPTPHCSSPEIRWEMLTLKSNEASDHLMPFDAVLFSVSSFELRYYDSHYCCLPISSALLWKFPLRFKDTDFQFNASFMPFWLALFRQQIKRASQPTQQQQQSTQCVYRSEEFCIDLSQCFVP